jgi:adenosine deaminase
MNENFVQTFEATGLTAQQAYVLAQNSFEASFATEQQKNQWLHALKQTFQKFSEQD